MIDVRSEQCVEETLQEDSKYKIVRSWNRGAESPYYTLYEKVSVLFNLFSWWSIVGWSTNLSEVRKKLYNLQEWDKAYETTKI